MESTKDIFPKFLISAILFPVIMFLSAIFRYVGYKQLDKLNNDPVAYQTYSRWLTSLMNLSLDLFVFVLYAILIYYLFSHKDIGSFLEHRRSQLIFFTTFFVIHTLVLLISFSFYRQGIINSSIPDSAVSMIIAEYLFMSLPGSYFIQSYDPLFPVAYLLIYFLYFSLVFFSLVYISFVVKESTPSASSSYSYKTLLLIFALCLLWVVIYYLITIFAFQNYDPRADLTPSYLLSFYTISTLLKLVAFGVGSLLVLPAAKSVKIRDWFVNSCLGNVKRLVVVMIMMILGLQVIVSLSFYFEQPILKLIGSLRIAFYWGFLAIFESGDLMNLIQGLPLAFIKSPAKVYSIFLFQTVVEMLYLILPLLMLLHQILGKSEINENDSKLYHTITDTTE